MKMSNIQSIAKERGVFPGHLTKADLVRTLQQEEGNTACFQTGQAESCGQEGCLWRAVCA
jgi:hypothetical protein